MKMEAHKQAHIEEPTYEQYLDYLIFAHGKEEVESWSQSRTKQEIEELREEFITGKNIDVCIDLFDVIKFQNSNGFEKKEKDFHVYIKEGRYNLFLKLNSEGMVFHQIKFERIKFDLLSIYKELFKRCIEINLVKKYDSINFKTIFDYSDYFSNLQNECNDVLRSISKINRGFGVFYDDYESEIKYNSKLVSEEKVIELFNVPEMIFLCLTIEWLLQFNTFVNFVGEIEKSKNSELVEQFVEAVDYEAIIVPDILLIFQQMHFIKPNTYKVELSDEQYAHAKSQIAKANANKRNLVITRMTEFWHKNARTAFQEYKEKTSSKDVGEYVEYIRKNWVYTMEDGKIVTRKEYNTIKNYLDSQIKDGKLTL